MDTAEPASVSKPARPADGDLAAALRVLETAGDAIAALATTLNADFSRALDIIVSVEGRLIVSGMGKSGHIGRKIASTLASTGTPAHFVHPAEAGHGDLGALTRQDALLILSNSGDTAELSHLITFAKRFSIPLIGVASRAESALLQAADVALVLPKSREACPMGLAPTTSTTLMLVLGDALAVALMERRGFTSDEYRLLHPSGSLGKALIRVMDIMHKGEDMPLVDEDATVRDAVLEIAARRFGCVGIVDRAGALSGIFTDGDLARHMDPIDPGLFLRPIREVMTSAPKIVAPRQLAAEALALMNEKKITVLFVVDADDASHRPIGILHMHDCLRAGLQ